MEGAPSLGLTLRGLSWRHLRFDRASTVALWLALLLALVLSIAPPVIEGVTATATLQRTLASSAGLTIEGQGVTTATAFDSFQTQAQEQVQSRTEGYLGSGTPLAWVGSLSIASVGGQARPAASSPPAVVSYLQDFSTHVEMVQGQRAGGAPAGQGAAVSLPEDAAARESIHPGDVVCFKTPANASWCAQVVGLWRPLRANDPYWNLQPGSVTVQTDLRDLLALLAMAPGRGTVARRYLPAPSAITPGDAADVAQRIHMVGSTGAAAGAPVVNTTLDRDLDQYAASRRVALFDIQLLTAALVALSILLIGALGRSFLDQRASDLVVLRARGWSAWRVRRLVATETVTLAGAALVPALAITVAAGAVLGVTSAGSAVRTVGLDELWCAGAAAVVLAAGSAGAIGLLMARASRAAIIRLEAPDFEVAAAATHRRGTLADRLAGLPASSQALVPPLMTLAPGMLDDRVRAVVAVVALVVLAAAIRRLISPAAWLVGVLYSGVDGTLARWRLRRWGRGNVGAGSLLVVSFATAVFSAVTLASLAWDGTGRATWAPLLDELSVSLAVGLAGSAVAALTADGLVFLFAVRRRTPDHVSLLLDGLPARSLRRSLAIEQYVVLMVTLVMGAVLGLTLAWAAAPPPGPSLGAMGAGACVVALLVITGGIVSGWLVRRRATRFPRLEGQGPV